MNMKFKRVVFIVVFIVFLLFANKVNVFGVDEQVNNTVEAEEEQKQEDDETEQQETQEEKITTINLKYDENDRLYQNNTKYYQIQDSIKITGGDYELSTSSIGLKVLKVNQKLLGKTTRLLY